MKEVIRWGIIGCGDVVETKNGPAFYLAEGSELAGIWNRTKSKAVDWCQRHGHGHAYDTLEELLEDPTIDIIYVATPPNVHKQYAIQVAQAHKHCYLEKPIALLGKKLKKSTPPLKNRELAVLLRITAAACLVIASSKNYSKLELLAKSGACR